MLSIQARQALSKLVLPLLFLLATGILLLGIARRPMVEQVRMVVADGLGPGYALMAQPSLHLRAVWTDIRGVMDLAGDNARLRAENDKLRRWYDVAVALANENAKLKASLHWIPDNAPRFVTGHAVRDAGGLYNRAILLAVSDAREVHVGDVALDAAGFIGRVTEVGHRTARVLLVTDQASRIPVALEASHGTAIMAGDGSDKPRLKFYAQDNHPVEGERVYTSEQAPPDDQNGQRFSGLPGGLPVGIVHYTAAGEPIVIPDGLLSRPDIVRLFDYGDLDLDGPAAPGRVHVPPPHSGPLAPGASPEIKLPSFLPGHG